jgi:nucleoside-diphosphate-sugar epimerase
MRVFVAEGTAFSTVPENSSTLKMMDLVRHRRLPVIRGDRGLLPFVQIDDAVSATVAALDRAPAGGVYDIVDDRALSLSELVRTISQQLGVAAPFTMPAWSGTRGSTRAG